MIEFAMEHPIATTIIAIVALFILHDMNLVWARAYAYRKRKEGGE